MRAVSALVLVLLMSPALAQPSKPPPKSAAEVFAHYRLFGEWAVDCAADASPSNPHVTVTRDAGGIVETHDLGQGYAMNRYSISEARAVSPTRVALKASFQADDRAAQPQELVVSVRGETRRTLFTKVEGGPVRVRHGRVVGYRLATPRLRKCG
jgi:hypothetical protein